MKDSLVDRFTSSRGDQWIPKRQVFQVLRKFPLYLPTFSVGDPPFPLFFHPRHGRWPTQRVKRQREKRIKGNAFSSAVNVLHVMVTDSPNNVVVKIVEIFSINRRKILSPLRDLSTASGSILFVYSLIPGMRLFVRLAPYIFYK